MNATEGSGVSVCEGDTMAEVKPAPANPFNAESFALANAIEASARETLAYYDKLTSCGLDCQAAREQAQAQLDFVHALRDHFGAKT